MMISPTCRHTLAVLSLLSPIAHATPALAQSQADSDKAEDDIKADRPGLADSSDVVGAGRFQVEAGVQAEFRQGDNASTSIFAPVLLRYGTGRNWELRVEGDTFNHVSTDTGGGLRDRDTGFAPTSIGVKYRMLDGKGAAHPSAGVIARIFPPSGTGSFRTDRTTGDFRVAIDWGFTDKLSLNPNVGFAVNQDDANQLYHAGLFALTLGYDVTNTINLFVDTEVQTPEAKHGGTSMIIDAGVAIVVGHNLQLDLSAGTGAAGATSPHPFLSAGISRRF